MLIAPLRELLESARGNPIALGLIALVLFLLGFWLGTVL